MSLKERRGLPGLNADRADIILTGLAILDRVMARLKTNVLRVHTGGVRDGLLLSMLEQLPSHRRPAIDRREAIEQFALSCGADLDHARHVARLSGQLYDELVRCVDLEPGDKEVLQAAALLQDCGYLISYKQHHRHSFQLIVNSQLAGFRRHDLELIANVARYHRGARPKQKHANFRKLNKADQRRVRRLAAILRIAGGLDRGHTQNVQRLSVRATTGHIVIHVSARHDPDLELWAARSRSDLFERVFRRGVSIHAMPRPEEEYAGVPQPAAAGVPGQALVNIGSAQET
jgi:exopolyphosphatase/guanosine-5'-triphosphate,3'-diphosphate pyrophosphatase